MVVEHNPRDTTTDEQVHWATEDCERYGPIVNSGLRCSMRMVCALHGKVCCGAFIGNQLVSGTFASEAEHVRWAHMEHRWLSSCVFEGCNHGCDVSARLAVGVHVGKWGVGTFRDVGSSGDHDLNG